MGGCNLEAIGWAAMRNENKTKQQLIDELNELRRQVAEFKPMSAAMRSKSPRSPPPPATTRPMIAIAFRRF